MDKYVGHNAPDSVRLSLRADELIETTNRWLTERPEITDDEMAAKAEDFHGQLHACWKDAEASRKEEKQPHLDASTAVDAVYNPIKARLEVAKKLINKKLQPFVEERERKAREEEKRKEAEALAAIEAAEAAKKEAATETDVDVVVAAETAEKTAKEKIANYTRATKKTGAIRGEFSDKARGLKTSYSAKITDFDKALAHFANHEKVREVVQQLADGHVRSPKTREIAIPGVEVVTGRSL